MQATAATLLLLVALVATGGEARAGDGGSARQLLTNPQPPICKDPKCYKALKDGCKWLPKADLKCDDGGKHTVYVKNCFKDKVGYISIYAGGKCTKYSNYGGDTIAELDLNCGDEITIYGFGKYLKGDGSTACSEDASRQAGNYCKTCKYIAKYKCPYAHHPGDVCRHAYGNCDVAALFDKYCNCPANGYLSSSYVCRNSTGPCDDGAKCTGMDAKCPHSGYKDDTTVCRPSTGPCDKAEYCTGKSGDCPYDTFASNDTVCRESYGNCDVPEYCTGKDGKCPDDGFLPKTTVCRAAAGPCDADENCTGYSKDCPADYCIDYRNTKPEKLEQGACPVKVV